MVYLIIIVIIITVIIILIIVIAITIISNDNRSTIEGVMGRVISNQPRAKRPATGKEVA